MPERGEIWLADDVPFGWVKYHVKLTRQEKDITAPPTAFAPAAEIDVEMTMVKKETSGAKSELGDVTEETAAPAAEEKTEKPEAEKPETEKTEEEKPATEKAEDAEKQEEKPESKTPSE